MTEEVNVVVLDDIDKNLDSKDKAILEVTPKNKTKSKQITLVNFILDGSGSMGTCYNDTLGSFNTYVETLKKDEGNYHFSLTIFNYKSNIIYTNKKIEDVPVLDKTVYIPSGGTALFDSIGSTVTAVDESLAKKKTKNKVLVIILTDGEENCSKEYNKTKITEVIKEHESRGNWTFVYLGANQDAFTVGTSMGFAGSNTMSYNVDAIGSTIIDLAGNTASYSKSPELATKIFFANTKNSDDNNKENTN